VPYAWQTRGKATLTLPSTRSQQLNVLGLINRNNDSAFEMVSGSVTSEVVIGFITRFALSREIQYQQDKKPCIIILDNASMHRSKAFKAELENWEAMGVIIHYLPPYSPELNLIEILWRRIKYSWLPLGAYKSIDVLKGKLSAILEGVGEKYCITFR